VRLERLRYRGYAGGVIPAHRALLVLPMNRREFGYALLLAAALAAGWVLALGWVSSGWAKLLAVLSENLGLHAAVIMYPYQLGATWGIEVPYLDIGAAVPDGPQWWLSCLSTVLVLIVSLLLPRRFVPLIYWLRTIAVIHVSALFFFAFFPGSFPYNVADYHAGMMTAGMALVALVPVAFGFTYYMFDVGLARKLGITLLAMLHLAILVPLQYLAHVYILHHLSLLYMPVLFVVFGLPLDIFAFIAFYAWGMSWQRRVHE
jgi:hypothetical protein